VVVRSEQSPAQARSWWWAAATSVAVVGWGAALLTTPPSALIASTVVVSGCSLLVSTAVLASPWSRGRDAGSATGDRRQLVDHTLLGTLGAIAAIGLLQVSVTLTFALGLCLAATAAWARPWHPAAVRQRPVPPARQGRSGSGARTVPAAPFVEPDVGAMTTSELVLAWRRSYAELAAAGSPRELATLAARRRQLIDELERRDGVGIERWLRSGARAASDPSRYLQRPAGPSAA
jgi:hypothetical protein